MVLALLNGLRRLVYGCWLDHGPLLRERRGRTYWHRCERCGYTAKILPGQKAKYRRQLPAKVLQMPKRKRA